MRGWPLTLSIALCGTLVGPIQTADAVVGGTTEIRVAVLLVNFTRQPSEPWTRQFVHDIYFGAEGSVAAYYAELSNGRVSITGSVFGYLTIAADTSRCAYKSWGTAARDAARAGGIDLAAYSTIVYAFPYQPVCWWGGYARTGSSAGPGRDTWINGLFSLYLASHELGHNLGADHAGSISCTDGGEPVAFSATCRTYAYGDPYDTMGYTGQRHMHAWHRWKLGLLDPDEVATVSESGRYLIAPAEARGADPRLIRIPRASGDYYVLELRQTYGEFDDFPAGSPAINGISIRIVRDTGHVPSKLIDTTPATCTFIDAPLTVGQTFADAVNHIAITTLSVGPTGAEVRIQTNYQGSAAGPSTTMGIVATDTSPPGTPRSVLARMTTGRWVEISWAAAADDNGVDHYVVRADGNVVGRTCDLVLEDIVVEDARTYEFSVRAVDLAGNAGPPASVRITIPDVTSPSSARRVRASATSAATIRLVWKAATDNTAVDRYRLHRDGTRIADLGADVLTYSDRSLAPGRSYRYTLTAIDAAGNASVPIKVRATTPQ